MDSSEEGVHVAISSIVEVQRRKIAELTERNIILEAALFERDLQIQHKNSKE